MYILFDYIIIMHVIKLLFGGDKENCKLNKNFNISL